MRSKGLKQTTAVGLVLFGTALGLVIAGAADLAPRRFARTEPAPEMAVRIPEVPAASVTLPGFADLAAAVSPAVVSVRATRIEEEEAGSVFDIFRERRRPAPFRGESGGSGFVISSDGLVVTNHHVIEGAREVEVSLGARQYAAEVVGDDPATDIALLSIEPEAPLPFLELGDSGALRVGSWVMILGSPLQLDNSVSVGVVSAKGRSINITPDSSLENFIQTDAAINFGNSGGPMVDLDGRVVGIATAINYGAENIGFAVPVDTLAAILPQLRTAGTVRRGYLGVEIDEVGWREARAWGLDRARGVVIGQVLAGGPSADAGLEHGDVVLEVDGRPVERSRDLIDYVSSRPPGTEVELRIFRDGEEAVRQVELGERRLERAAAARPEPAEERSFDGLGLEIQDLDPALRRSHGMPAEVTGVWVTGLTPTSPLWDADVRTGDVIAEVGGEPVADVAAFAAAMEELESGEFVRLYVRRIDPRGGGVSSFFAVVEVP